MARSDPFCPSWWRRVGMLGIVGEGSSACAEACIYPYDDPHRVVVLGIVVLQPNQMASQLFVLGSQVGQTGLMSRDSLLCLLRCNSILPIIPHAEDSSVGKVQFLDFDNGFPLCCT